MEHKPLNKYIVFILRFLYFIPIFFNPSFIFAGENYEFERLWPTFQQPWNFQSPLNIASDSRGNIYVTNLIGKNIQKYTSEGKFITEWGHYGDSETEFSGPFGIAVSRDDFIYVSDRYASCIKKFSEDGSFIKSWGIFGRSKGEFDKPSGIAVDSKGDVYIADFNNNRVQKFSSQGVFITSWGSAGTSSGQFLGPIGIAIDPKNNNVFVSDYNNDRIQVFTSDGLFVKKFGSFGTDLGFIDGPAALSIYENSLYVSDQKNNRIQIFNTDGEYISSWGSYGNHDSQFDEPSGIAVFMGNVYISDTQNNRIQKFFSDGRFQTRWGKNGSDQFFEFHDIASDSDGNIYASDHIGHYIWKFDQYGVFINKWGGYGSNDGQFWYPSGIAIYGNSIYIVDKNNRVQKFTLDGILVSKWGKKGNAQSEFNEPQDIAVDSLGNVYVADTFNDRIQKFSDKGVFIKQLGSYGNASGQFSEPRGIAIGFDDHIFIVDHNNNRIQEFGANTEFIRMWGQEGLENGQFKYPSGIALDNDKNIYISDTYNNRIQKFDYKGEFIGKFGTYGKSPGQLDNPHALVLNKNGRIYVADTRNNRIQVFRHTSLPTFKAIIVAGGGAYSGNNLWEATEMCANFAYRALVYQGLNKHGINYLSSDMDLDLDGNGILDDVDSDATNQNLQTAISEWAVNVDNLLVYIINHGGDGVFRMNDQELLKVEELDKWLDDYQQNSSTRVIVIYDACKSGSFLNALTPPPGKDRIVITSSLDDESAYFVAHGSISFSSYFWTHIFNGTSLFDAFASSKAAMHYTTEFQNPLLDDNNNGIGNEPNDGIISKTLYIGNGTYNYGQAPIITSVSSPQVIQGQNTAKIYADQVTDDNGIARVWAIIRPPGYQQLSTSNPVHDLPYIELTPVGQGRYESEYDQFNISGSYKIAIYAMDREGNISIPAITTVSVTNQLSRKAIILVGNTTETLGEASERMGRLAYGALSFQGYLDEDLFYMNPDTELLGVDATPSKANFQQSISWAKLNTQDLVVYIVGKGNKDSFQINESEQITAPELKTIFDDLQQYIEGSLTFIYDAERSGSFISELTPKAGQNRIVITSTGKASPAYFLANGEISFSSFFWRRILNGANISLAFSYAVNAITYSVKDQIPMIDDNGNGISNENGVDGNYAVNYTIGTGIMLASDDPIIKAISQNQVLAGNTKAHFYADHTTSIQVVTRVWAVVDAPQITINQLDRSITDLPIYPFVLKDNGRYEADIDAFNVYGWYDVLIFAADAYNNISLPQKTRVFQSIAPDVYEDDKDMQHAVVIVINDEKIQRHNFHNADDSDWVLFYATAGNDYTVQATSPENRCDSILSLYDSNGTPIIDQKNLQGPAMEEFMSWKCQTDGIYYIKVSNAFGVFGEQTGYDLKVFSPTGIFPGYIYGTITEKDTKLPIKYASVSTDGNASAISNEQGIYVIVDDEGVYMLKATKAGYDDIIQKVRIYPLDETLLHLVMLPKDTDKDGLSDQLELVTNTNPYDDDTDGDDLKDGIEDINHNGTVDADETDPRKFDTDNDGIKDGWESQQNLDPLKDDSEYDKDADGYSNGAEYRLGTNPSAPDPPGKDGYRWQSDNRIYKMDISFAYYGCKSKSITLEFYDSEDMKVPFLVQHFATLGEYSISYSAKDHYYLRAYMDINDNKMFDANEPVSMVNFAVTIYKRLYMEMKEKVVWNYSYSDFNADTIATRILTFDMTDENCDGVLVANSEYPITGVFSEDTIFISSKIDGRNYEGKGISYGFAIEGKNEIKGHHSPFSASINPEEISSPDLSGFWSIYLSFDRYDWSDVSDSNSRILSFYATPTGYPEEYTAVSDDGSSMVTFMAEGNKIYWTLSEKKNGEEIYFAKGSGTYVSDVSLIRIMGTYAAKESKGTGRETGLFSARLTPNPVKQVTIGSPSPIIYGNAIFSIPVMLDVGSSVLGDYTIAVTFNPAVVKLVDSKIRAGAMKIKSDETGVLTLTDNMKGNSGVVRLADLTFKVIGDPQTNCIFSVKNMEIYDSSGNLLSLQTVNGFVYVSPVFVRAGNVAPMMLYSDAYKDFPINIDNLYNVTIKRYSIKVHFNSSDVTFTDAYGGTTPSFSKLTNFSYDNVASTITVSGENLFPQTQMNFVNVARINFRGTSTRLTDSLITMEIENLESITGSQIGRYVESARIRVALGSCGDVDESGELELKDSLLLISYLTDDVDASKVCLSLADVNDNDEIDIGDSMLLNQYIAHELDCICVGTPREVCR